MPEYLAPGVIRRGGELPLEVDRGSADQHHGLRRHDRRTARSSTPQARSTTEPRLITSFTEFERVYGGLDPLLISDGGTAPRTRGAMSRTQPGRSSSTAAAGSTSRGSSRPTAAATVVAHLDLTFGGTRLGVLAGPVAGSLRQRSAHRAAGPQRQLPARAHGRPRLRDAGPRSAARGAVVEITAPGGTAARAEVPIGARRPGRGRRRRDDGGRRRAGPADDSSTSAGNRRRRGAGRRSRRSCCRCRCSTRDEPPRRLRRPRHVTRPSDAGSADPASSTTPRTRTPSSGWRQPHRDDPATPGDLGRAVDLVAGAPDPAPRESGSRTATTAHSRADAPGGCRRRPRRRHGQGDRARGPGGDRRHRDRGAAGRWNLRRPGAVPGSGRRPDHPRGGAALPDRRRRCPAGQLDDRGSRLPGQVRLDPGCALPPLDRGPRPAANDPRRVLRRAGCCCHRRGSSPGSMPATTSPAGSSRRRPTRSSAG